MKKIAYVPLILTFTILLSLMGCSVPINKKFYDPKERVAVVLKVDSIDVFKDGAQGILDMAVSSGRKYKPALREIAASVNPKEEVKGAIGNFLESKKKPFDYVDEPINRKDLEKFKAPSDGKKYYKYDLRKLKTSHSADQVMITNVKHGLSISYYGFIELGIYGFCLIDVSIVDLRTNELLFKKVVQERAPIKGKWNTPPNYENLKKSMKKATDGALKGLKSNLGK